MAAMKFKPIPEITHETEQRFRKYVDKKGPDECWPWLGAASPRGYGVFAIRHNNTFFAQRIAYFLATGHNPTAMVCHHCDNPPCCNPKHLFHGTNADNVRDMISKGRQPVIPRPKGEDHPRSKLTAEQVRNAREIYSYGIPACRIAKQYGVDPKTIQALVDGKTWKTVH
jgi:hypothetical protein